MASEWKDPSATQQAIGTADDPRDIPPLPDDQPVASQNQVESDDDPIIFLDEAGDTDDLDETDPSLNIELLAEFSRQFSPVLIPLFSGGIIFLVTFPFVLRQQAYILPAGLLPIGLTFLAAAILQGTMLSWASDNKVWRALSIVTGVLLYLLIASFTLFGVATAGVVAVVMILGMGLTALLCFRPISEGYVAIVRSFGKYSRTFNPGFNILLPWERIDRRVDIRERQWTCPQQRVCLSQKEDILLKATISYRLIPADAHLAELQVENWHQQFQDISTTSLKTVATKIAREDFLSWEREGAERGKDAAHQSEEGRGWDRINYLLKRDIEGQVAEWGVEINWVHIHDVLPASHIPVNTESQATSIPTGTTASQGTSTSAGTPGSTKVRSEEALIKAYDQVYKGMIKDPDTIRSIAADFQTLARDPNALKTAKSDPAKAAEILLKHAQAMEERTKKAPDTTGNVKTGWTSRRATPSNLKGGG
jgi:hypothetical protein